MAVAGGTRLKCDVCGSEAIVVKPQEPVLSCCDRPMEIIFTPPAANPQS